jgi:hypothetical protein
MPKVFQHPLSDYHIYTGNFDVNSTPVYVPVPAAGYIKKITVCINVVQLTASSVITFNLTNNTLRVNGGTFTMTITQGSELGKCFVQEFAKPSAGQNRLANGAEEGDTLTFGDSIFWWAGVGGGDTGEAAFIVTIGRA